MINTKKYYPHLDGVRALLFLLIFSYHINGDSVPSGIVAMDFFFLLSGFVITNSFSKFSGGFLTTATTFYARRAKRIIPPLLTAITVASILSVLFIPLTFSTQHLQKMALFSHIGLANFNLILEGINYFEPKTYFNPFVHLWSLGVEEQFYFIFPFLFYFSFILVLRFLNLVSSD